MNAHRGTAQGLGADETIVWGFFGQHDDRVADRDLGVSDPAFILEAHDFFRPKRLLVKLNGGGGVFDAEVWGCSLAYGRNRFSYACHRCSPFQIGFETCFEILARKIPQLGGKAQQRSDPSIHDRKRRIAMDDDGLHRIVELFDQAAPSHFVYPTFYRPSPATFACHGIEAASQRPRCARAHGRFRGYFSAQQSASR